MLARIRHNTSPARAAATPWYLRYAGPGEEPGNHGRSQERHTQITFRCSPYHVNSALYPMITYLEQLLQVNRDDPPETKLTTLARMLEAYRFPNTDTLPLLAELLFIPLQEPGALSHLTPEQQKHKTQEALLAWFAEEAERQPILAVWEDLQWMDPSTLALLSLPAVQGV